MLDDRIGILNSGTCYAYLDGYSDEPFYGTYSEVHNKLNGHNYTSSSVENLEDNDTLHLPRASYAEYTVLQKFQFPAWDEINGILYENISARKKSEAIKYAKALAFRDGHICTGKGKIWFKAVLKDNF